MLILLNKTFRVKIQMRSIRFVKNFEHLTEREKNFQHNCLIQSHIDEFECDSVRDRRIVIQNSDIHVESLINCEFENDFRFDFVEHRRCVSRIDSNIDSNRVDQNRIDFDLNKSRFKHLNNDSDANQS